MSANGESEPGTSAIESRPEPIDDVSKQINQKKTVESVDGGAESKPATDKASTNGSSDGVANGTDHDNKSEEKEADLSKPGEKYSSNVKPVTLKNED